MNGVRRVGLVVHPGRPEGVVSAVRAIERLRGHGVECVVADTDLPDLPDLGDVDDVDRSRFPEGLDVVVSFGGDGTFLRAAHRSRDAGVPVLGVNHGRIGFLAEVEPDQLDERLDALVEGRHTIEPRATIEATVHDADGELLGADWALNDVSVEKTARQRLLLMAVSVGDEHFAEVPADALVLATATGSTAYALSAGGPILSPRVAATLVTPVAPHSLFDRTLVVAPEEVVRVRVLPDQAPAVLSVDGRDPLHVPPGGEVRVVGTGRPVRLVRMSPPDFLDRVRRKFFLS